MRKSMALSFAVVVGVFLMTLPGSAQETSKKFTLKLSGGYGNLSGGDLTTVADGLNEQLADIARLAGASTSGEITNAKWGPEFEGEFIYNFTERCGDHSVDERAWWQLYDYHAQRCDRYRLQRLEPV